MIWQYEEEVIVHFWTTLWNVKYSVYSTVEDPKVFVLFRLFKAWLPGVYPTTGFSYLYRIISFSSPLPISSLRGEPHFFFLHLYSSALCLSNLFFNRLGLLRCLAIAIQFFLPLKILNLQFTRRSKIQIHSYWQFFPRNMKEKWRNILTRWNTLHNFVSYIHDFY